MDTKKVTTFLLSPKDQLIINRIQAFLKPSLGNVSQRAAITWALDLASDKLDREERKAKYMAEVK